MRTPDVGIGISRGVKEASQMIGVPASSHCPREQHWRGTGSSPPPGSRTMCSAPPLAKFAGIGCHQGGRQALRKGLLHLGAVWKLRAEARDLVFPWKAAGLVVGSALAQCPSPWGKHAVLWFCVAPALPHCLPSAHWVEPRELGQLGDVYACLAPCSDPALTAQAYCSRPGVCMGRVGGAALPTVVGLPSLALCPCPSHWEIWGPPSATLISHRYLLTLASGQAKPHSRAFNTLGRNH